MQRLELSAPRPRATLVVAALLVMFYCVMYSLVPDALPWLLHRLVALTNAVLAMLLVLFAFDERRPDVASRLKWRHIDLGKVLGLMVFTLVLLWWFSRWSPKQVESGLSAQYGVSQVSWLS